MHLRPLPLAIAGVSLIAAVATPAAADILTGPITNPANGNTYYLLEPDSWDNSEAEAVALGGHLVTVNDAAENQWIYDTFDGGVGRNLWLGYNDVAVEGTFVWSSGETPGYTNWRPGEPNDGVGFPSSNQDYARMTAETPLNWDDISAEDALNPNLSGGMPFGVVEVVPEPTSIGLLGVAGLLTLKRRRR